MEDLTRSDDGKAIMSMNNYRNLVRRKQVNILRPGKGLGSCALIEYSSLPERFRRRFESKYGDPEVLLSRDKSALVINAEARRFFAGLEPGTFRLPNGETLPDDKVEEYTLNASVLDALHEEVENNASAATASRTPHASFGRIFWLRPSACGRISTIRCPTTKPD